VSYFFTYWLFLSQIWLLLGFLFILLELTDGSAIFFLPMGIGSFIIALLLYAVSNNYLPVSALPNTWYWLLVIWMIASLIISVALATIRRRNSKNSDINEY
jgi:membrane protein implicated in regulation of membrane protease activity